MKTIKKHFILLLGVGVFVTFLFSFNHSTYSGGYFYNDEALPFLGVASVLIVIGLLKMREEKDEK